MLVHRACANIQENYTNAQQIDTSPPPQDIGAQTCPLQGGESIIPPAFRVGERVGEHGMKLDIVGGTTVPPCRAGGVSISRSLLYVKPT